MLSEVDPIDLHYMTDRHKRFDLKISKFKLLWKQRQGKGKGKIRNVYKAFLFNSKERD